MSRPSRRELKNHLLWAARMLAGEDGSPYPGGVRVTIIAGAEGESITVSPTSLVDGLAAPRPAVPTDTLAGELLCRFLGEYARAILEALTTRQPQPGKTLMKSSGVPRDHFYAITKDLQERGLLANDDGGYRLTHADLWDSIRQTGPKPTLLTEGQRPAA